MRFSKKSYLRFAIVLLAFATSAAADSFTMRLTGWEATISPSSLMVLGKTDTRAKITVADGQIPQDIKGFSYSESKAEWSIPSQHLSVVVEAKGKWLHVRFKADKETSLAWPSVREERSLNSLIVPDGEGLYLPVTDSFWLKQFESGYCRSAHSGLSMPFLGTRFNQAAFLYLFPLNLRTEVCINQADGRLFPSARHTFQSRDQLSDYEVIISPVEQSPISPALEYRGWLQKMGGFTSLKEKLNRNPNVDKLVGASHAYLWGDGRSLNMIAALKELGIDRMWLGYDQDPRSEKFLVTKDVVSAAIRQGYLIGPYDAFDNIQSPKSSDAVNSLFDDELFKSGCVRKKDGSKMVGFAGRGCQLSSEALRIYKKPFVAERVANHKSSGINSYFLDCDAFGDFLDDYDPTHSMNKARDRENRTIRMRFISENGDLVLGSEGGTAWAAQLVHFLHGANDTFNDVLWPLMKDKQKFGGWWPLEAMGIFFKKIKVDDAFATAKYSPKYRVPLFQTVFHDSVISTERWEMSLPKIPSLAQTRAIFWQLYNVAPIWNLNNKEFQRYKKEIGEHHRFFSGVHRKIAFTPLSEFEWLDSEKLVQRIRFGEHVDLTANFSDIVQESVKPLCIEYRDSRRNERLSYCPAKMRP